MALIQARNWMLNKKHDFDMSKIYKAMGNKTPKVLVFAGKKGHEWLGRLGHDSFGFSRCKCQNHTIIEDRFLNPLKNAFGSKLV